MTPWIFKCPNWTVDFWTNGGGVISKFAPHLYAWKRRFVGVVLKEINSIFTNQRYPKKHPLPIPIKIAVCTPSCEQCLPFVYRKPVYKLSSHLIAIEKSKVNPSFCVIYILFTCFKRSPLLSSHRNGKKLRLSHLIATEKWKPHPLLKKIPHLYEKNQGFYTPFWRLWTTYLQYVYKNWPCKRKLQHGHHQDLKMRSCPLA